VVRDAGGQALAYVYARATMAEAMQAKTLTQGRSSADCGEYCAAAWIAEEWANAARLM
jgi:hypothetical protein